MHGEDDIVNVGPEGYVDAAAGAFGANGRSEAGNAQAEGGGGVAPALAEGVDDGVGLVALGAFDQHDW